MDGYLKIKTKIDNKDVDKGITELENKIKKLQVENANSSKEQSSLQDEIDNFETLCNKANEYKQKIKELKEQKANFTSQFNGYIPDSQMSNYNMIQSQLETARNKYASITSEIDKQAPKIDKVYSRLDKIKSKQSENNKKITEFKQKIEQINVNKIQKGIDNVGKSIQNQIGKIGKMAMAIIGIRTAYGAVRTAISMVSQYNEQISTDLEYMRFCIANMLAPAVQWLIRLLYTVLSYVNAIATAWFGINLFGNSSAKAFQKMQNSASSTAKSAKEIQKSLQGFDEMNVLQDTSDSSGNSGGGITAPSVDLSGMQGEIPEWLQWIIDNKDIILSVLAGIAGAILAIKFGLDLIKALGIGILIAGIVYTLQAFLEYLKDPSWENFGKIIIGIGIAILGLGIIIGSIPVIVAGAIVIIVGLVIKYWEQIKGFLQGIVGWINEQADNIKNCIDNNLQWIKDNFGIVGQAIATYLEFAINFVVSLIENAINDTIDYLEGLFNGAKNIVDGIIKIFQGDFQGGIAQVGEGIKQIFTAVWNHTLNTFTVTWRAIIGAFSKGGQLFDGFKDGLFNIFKTILNAAISAINWVIAQPFNRLNNTLNTIKSINVLGAQPFNGLWGWNPIPVPQIPKLAKGGIITQPTQAIIGEAGKEAVMPLENNLEWLDILADKLASKIGNNGGAYIIQMDGRTVQRGIAKRQQGLAFMTNGR